MYVADKLRSSDAETAIKQTAAYLIETKQKRTVELLVSDIEEELAKDGTFVADITSARPLTAEDKMSISALLGAKELHTRESIDPAVLGGVRVEVSGKRLDATLKHKIDLLKEISSRKGSK